MNFVFDPCSEHSGDLSGELSGDLSNDLCGDLSGKLIGNLWSSGGLHIRARSFLLWVVSRRGRVSLSSRLISTKASPWLESVQGKVCWKDDYGSTMTGPLSTENRPRTVSLIWKTWLVRKEPDPIKYLYHELEQRLLARPRCPTLVFDLRSSPDVSGTRPELKPGCPGGGPGPKIGSRTITSSHNQNQDLLDQIRTKHGSDPPRSTKSNPMSRIRSGWVGFYRFCKDINVIRKHSWKYGNMLNKNKYTYEERLLDPGPRWFW